MGGGGSSYLAACPVVYNMYHKHINQKWNIFIYDNL